MKKIGRSRNSRNPKWKIKTTNDERNFVRYEAHLRGKTEKN